LVSGGSPSRCQTRQASRPDPGLLDDRASCQKIHEWRDATVSDHASGIAAYPSNGGCT
jgi:hypothetical protein